MAWGLGGLGQPSEPCLKVPRGPGSDHPSFCLELCGFRSQNHKQLNQCLSWNHPNQPGQDQPVTQPAGPFVLLCASFLNAVGGGTVGADWEAWICRMPAPRAPVT